jgi:hypothetical protein
MPLEDVVQLLADNGVDVQALDPTQLAELVQHYAGEAGGGLVETVTGWLGSLFSSKS